MNSKLGSDDLQKAAIFLLQLAREDGGTFIVATSVRGVIVQTGKGRTWNDATDFDFEVILNHCIASGWVAHGSGDNWVITHAGLVMLEQEV